MRILVSCFLLLVGQAVVCQNKQLLYNVQGLPQSLLLNPGAEVSFDLHVGLPFFSQSHISAGSSGVSVYDILKEGETSIDENIRTAILGMSNKDFFIINQQLALLSLGMRIDPDKYISAGIYQEADVLLYFPRDVAVLLFEGNVGPGDQNFELSEVAASAEILNVFHLGLSLDLNKNLSIGARGKIYSSMMNLRSVNNEGQFISGRHGRAEPAIRDLDISIKTSGISFLDGQSTTSGGIAKDMVTNGFLGGNLGLGADVGFTYYLSDKYKVTGSLQDIGFIRHSKDVRNYSYRGNLEMSGLQEPFLGGTVGTSVPDPYRDFEDNFEEERWKETYYSTRPLKLNASMDYGFGEILESCNCYEESGRRKYYNHLGLQMFSMKRPNGFVHAATLSFDKKLSSNFFGKLTYTVDSFSLSNVGLLFSARFSYFNIYMAADNVLVYRNIAKARNAALQVGIQFLLENG